MFPVGLDLEDCPLVLESVHAPQVFLDVSNPPKHQKLFFHIIDSTGLGVHWLYFADDLFE